MIADEMATVKIVQQVYCFVKNMRQKFYAMICKIVDNMCQGVNLKSHFTGRLFVDSLLHA